MHRPPRACRLITFAIAITASLAWCHRGAAIDILPPEIPRLEVGVDDAVQEAVRAVGKIESQSDRVRALTRVLYDVRELDPPKYQPLVEQLEAALLALGNKDEMLSAGEVLYHLKPEVALRLCREISDPTRRDFCLRYYVRAADHPPAVLRPFLELVANPQRRLECVQSLARKRRATLEEIRSALREAKSLSDPSQPPGDLYSLAAALSRFPEAETESVIALVRDEFAPDDQVQILAHMAGQWDHWKKSPEMAKGLLNAALKRVPECTDRDRAVRSLLHHGLARHEPRLALEWFDREVEPKLKRTLTESALAQLAPAGIDEALSRADRMAERFGLPREQLRAHVLGSIATSIDPAPAWVWLQAAEPSPVRDAAVAKIANGQWQRASQSREDLATVQTRVDSLAKLAHSIEDEIIRRDACEAIFNVTRFSKPQPIQLPRSVRDDYAEQWPQIKSQLAPERLRSHIAKVSGLLPDDEQRNAIRHELDGKEPRAAAALVWRSTLPRAERLRHYEEVLEQMREIPDMAKRSAALASVSRCLQTDDPALSLRLLWEGLQIARELKLPRQYHDLYDGLGSVFPYVTADECLRSTIDNHPAEPATTIKALWSFARTLESQSDREAVLETVVELLLRHKDTARAAGAADLVADPSRRIKVWTAIAVVTAGKELREDW